MKSPQGGGNAKKANLEKKDDSHVELNIKGKSYIVSIEEDNNKVENQIHFFHHKKSPMRLGPNENSRLLDKPIDNLKLHSREEFENTVEDSDSIWTSLPLSINGTLIYTLLVEQNTRTWQVGEYFQITFLTGMPVFFTFWIQGLLIYWINDITPTYEDSSICVHSALLQHAVMMVYILFMYPSLVDIITEAYCCLRATRVAMKHEEKEDKILVYHIRAPFSKRLTTFLLVPAIEACILTLMTIIGAKFIITCDKTSDLIINSMAVAFVMDVDNMSREFFQLEAVSEHIDEMEFETKMSPIDSKLQGVDDKHTDEMPVHEEVDDEVVATFMCIEKVIIIVFVAGIYTYSLQYLYCQDEFYTTEQ